MPRSFRSQRPPRPVPSHRQIFVGEPGEVNEVDCDLLRKAMFDRKATELRQGQPVPRFTDIIGATAYEAALQAESLSPEDE